MKEGTRKRSKEEVDKEIQSAHPRDRAALMRAATRRGEEWVDRPIDIWTALDSHQGPPEKALNETPIIREVRPKKRR